MMQSQNLFDLVPERAAIEVSRQEGKARFEFPRFKSGPGRFFGSIFRASETIKVNLDVMGTAVWDMVDGRRSVTKIAEAIGGRFGEKVQPVGPRLAALFRVLERNRIIRFKQTAK